MKWIYRHPRFYDLIDSLISLSLSNRVRRNVLSGLVPRSFLEIGVGSGKSLRFVTSEVLMGVDTSLKMLSLAKSRFPEACLILGDAHKLPLRDACVEVSLFSYCLRGLTRPLEAVREALRVSSKVIVIDYGKPTFIPRFLWDHVVERFGRAIFGSRDLDFESIGHLAQNRQVEEFYQRLYRVVVLHGAKHARD